MKATKDDLMRWWVELNRHDTDNERKELLAVWIWDEGSRLLADGADNDLAKMVGMADVIIDNHTLGLVDDAERGQKSTATAKAARETYTQQSKQRAQDIREVFERHNMPRNKEVYQYLADQFEVSLSTVQRALKKN